MQLPKRASFGVFGARPMLVSRRWSHEPDARSLVTGGVELGFDQVAKD
jgi:hypothetical protein